MKKAGIFLLLLLCFHISHALAVQTVSDSETASMRALIGTEPDDIHAVSRTSSAYETLFWITAMKEEISVDDRISAYLRLLQDTDDAAAVRLIGRLSELYSTLHLKALNPLNQAGDTLRASILRLSSLLDFLEGEELSEVETAACSTECRFLRDQILEANRMAMELSSSVPGAVAEAETALDAMTDDLSAIASRQLAIRREYSEAVSRQETDLIRMNARSLDVENSDGNDVHITVIDENQFSFTLRSGKDDGDIVGGATVIVTDCSDPTRSQTVQSSDKTGVAVLDVKNFTFRDRKSTVSVEVRKDGFREIFYTGCIVHNAENQTIPMTKDDGTPYLKEASINGDEMLHDSSNGFYYIRNSTYKYPVSFQLMRLPANASGTLSFQMTDPDSKDPQPLTVKIGDFTADKNGCASVKATDTYASLLKVTNRGVKIDLHAFASLKSGETYDFPLAFTVERALFEQISSMFSGLPSLLPGTINIALPKLEPILSDPSIDVGSPLVPAVGGRLDIDGGVTIYVGMTSVKPDLSMLEDGATKKVKEVSMKEVRESYSYAREVASTCREDGKVFKWKPAGNGLSWDWNAALAVCGKVDWRTDPEMPASGTLWLSASVSGTFSYTQQFLIPPPVSLPAYIGFDATVTLGAGGEFGVTFTAVPTESKTNAKDYHLLPKVQFGVNVDIEIGVSMGLGIQGLISGGLRGYLLLDNAFTFNVPTPHVEGNIYYQLNLSSGLDLEVKLVLINVKVHLISFSKSFPNKPYPFLPEQQKTAALSADGGAGLPAGRAGVRQEGRTRLPEAGQVLTLNGETVLRSEEDSPLAPDRENRFTGSFEVTALKPVTIPFGKNDYRDLVFLAGNDTVGSVGYTTVQYGISNGSNLELRGAAYSTEGTPPAQDWDAEYISDFDVCFDSSTNRVFLFVIHGYAVRDAQGGYQELCHIPHVLTFRLSGDGKSLERLAESGNNLIPASEAGHTEFITLQKPVIKPLSKHNGALFVAVGDDLHDADTQGVPLGHTKGRYIYMGFVTLEQDSYARQMMWRYNDFPLDSAEEVLQVICLPGENGALVNDKGTYLLTELSCAVLTGVPASAGSGGEQPLLAENRIRNLNASAFHQKSDNIYGYYPNPDSVSIGAKTTFMNTVDHIQASNIMPGFEDFQLFAVEQMSGQEGDEIGETTLSAYQFQWLKPDYTRTNFGITTSMNWFGETRLAGGNYLYWLKDYDTADPKPAGESGGEPRHILRACLYDPASHAFTPPFDLVQLSWSPRTVALSPIVIAQSAGGGETTYSGLYSTGSGASENDSISWQFVDFDYRLKTSLDLVSLTSPTGCAVAGKNTELYLKVDNTGNTLIAGFKVRLTGDGGTDLGTVTVNAADPTVCSIELYEAGTPDNGERKPAFSGGQEAVMRAPSDMANTGERLTLTTLRDGVKSLTEVASLGLIPTTQATYKISAAIPSSWRDVHEITAEITEVRNPSNDLRAYVSQADTADTDAGVFSAREIRSALASVSPQTAAAPVVNHSRRTAAKLNWSRDDLSLDMKTLRLEGREYLEILLRNGSDGCTAHDDGALCEPPMLVFTTADAEGRETETFRHTFANAIHTGMGYTLLIPRDLIDGDGAYNTLTASIKGAGAGYTEYNFSNNSESFGGSLHRIMIRTEGSGEAYAQNKAGGRITSAVAGEKVYLTALPAAGSRLLSWYAEDIEPGEDGSFVMPGYDVVITAVFSDALTLSGPEDVTVTAGGKASFTVTVDPDAEGFSCAWYVNRGAGWQRLGGETGRTLTIGSAAQKDDGNQYRCIVTDRFGLQYVSRTALLRVKTVPLTGDRIGRPLLLLCIGAVILIGLAGKSFLSRRENRRK